MAIRRQNRQSASPTETARLPIPLKIAGLTQSVEVHANVSGVQTDSSAMGRVVDGNMVTSLPLVTRNYTQIAVPKSCFTTPPVIGADGLGTAFENSGTGIVDGPGQVNVDLSLSKLAALHWPREESGLEFRAEFFNTLNHPQFANPDSNFSSSTFGVITSTSVNARVGQLGLTFSF